MLLQELGVSEVKQFLEHYGRSCALNGDDRLEGNLGLCQEELCGALHAQVNLSLYSPPPHPRQLPRSDTRPPPSRHKPAYFL